MDDESASSETGSQYPENDVWASEASAEQETEEIYDDSTSGKILRSFIETYKSLPELWNSSLNIYRNKTKRNAALNKLLVIYRKLKPEAKLIDVRRKINTLRSNYRKELKKLTTSKRSEIGTDEVYQPSSWVFYALHQFLYTWEQPVNASTQNNETLQPQETNVSANADTQFNMVYKGTKRKIPGPERNLLHKHTNTDLDEFEAVGVIVGKKLQRMDPLQAIYAEALINKVLMKGLLKNLSENTDVFENVPYYERQNPQTSNFFAENSPSSAPGSSQDGHFSQFHKKSQEILPQKEENE